jgi:hypothetical protein
MRWMRPCSRSRRRSQVAWPGVTAPGPWGGRPRYSPSRLRRSRLRNPPGVQPKEQQDVQQRLGARVGQAQPGDAGAVVVDDEVAGRAQDGGVGDGVVAESPAASSRRPSAVGVADLPQGGQVSQPFAHAEGCG